ncbi:LytR/AlgR family response regulator transcription factor [Chryseolinea lacunae]|uniref:Response regulator transcription factor n=1 Tax=Chryseolinea lacunae TaxID=2801331 RepID=A0ABS1KKG3_9BACT|nr:LytTR family DNA-binding domain-containing protein [Chryseolinea lacunae]MBL0739936.1 response regulator transcription factor [Chryseolinea lacunae]
MRAPISCIVADDDEVDRLTTLSFIRKHPILKVDGVFAGAEAVLNAMQHLTPDVLFLDIDMPHVSGLELREKLKHVPVCIFITAFPEYAVEAFEKEALDFLVKPVKADRFERVVERVQQYLDLKDKATLVDTALGGDAIFIKEGHSQIKIQLHNVLYLEALKDYTRIVTAERKYCVLSALGNLIKEKPFDAFVRIHRSYAVQKEFVSKVTTSHVEINEHRLPVGRSYKDALPLFSNSSRRQP